MPAGDVILDNAGNDFGGAVVTTATGNATLVDVNDLTLDTTTVGGSLTASGTSLELTGTVSVGTTADLTSTGGDIANVGAGNIQVTGTTTLNATGDVILDNAGNDFVGRRCHNRDRQCQSRRC